MSANGSQLISIIPGDETFTGCLPSAGHCASPLCSHWSTPSLYQPVKQPQLLFSLWWGKQKLREMTQILSSDWTCQLGSGSSKSWSQAVWLPGTLLRSCSAFPEPAWPWPCCSPARHQGRVRGHLQLPLPLSPLPRHLLHLQVHSARWVQSRAALTLRGRGPKRRIL